MSWHLPHENAEAEDVGALVIRPPDDLGRRVACCANAGGEREAEARRDTEVRELGVQILIEELLNDEPERRR